MIYKLISKAKNLPIWRNRLFPVILVILLVIASTLWYFLGRSTPARQQSTKSTPEYYTARVARGDFIISAKGSGELVAAQEVDLSFSASGTVGELNISVGDEVSTGDVLAKLENIEELEANVTESEINLINTKQELEDLQSNAPVTLANAYKTWIDAKGDYADALYADQKTAYARCNKETNTQNLKNLQSASEKLEQVSERYYGSDEWIEAKSLYDTALADYNYCISYTDDEKIEASATLQLTKVTMDNAEKAYNTLLEANGIDAEDLALAEAKVNEAEIAVKNAKEKLEGATLIAPIDGIVTSVAGNQGSTINPTTSSGDVETNATFITISQLTPPILEVSLDEADLDKISVGNAVTAVFDAFPTQTFTGKIIQLDPTLTESGEYNLVKGLVQLDSLAPEGIEHLPLGLSASIEVTGKESDNTLVVPVEALYEIGDGEYGVFTVGQKGVLTMKTVEVGLKDTTYAEIRSGLTEGEIVTTGIVSVSTAK